MKLYSADKSELMDVQSIERKGDDLVIKGKVFGSMPMAATLKPAEAKKMLKLVDMKTAWFFVRMLLSRK